MSRPSQSAEIADRILETCLSARVRKLSRAVTGIYDEELREVGIRTGQLSILGLVASRKRITQAALERALMMERSTVSRTVRRMCDRGWLATRPGRDARSHFLVLTESGGEVMSRAMEAWERAQARARHLLGDEGSDSLMALADALAAR